MQTRALPLLIAALCLQPLLGSSETAADAFQPKRGLNFDTWVEWLSVDQIVTRPGFLDTYPDWPRYIAPETVAAVKGQGYDFVRLPMEPGPLLRLGPGPAQDAVIAQMRKTADAVQATGVKVIVDLHAIPRLPELWGTETITENPAVFDAYIALTAKVGAALNGMDPARTAFELLNEPTNDCDALATSGVQNWPQMLIRLHSAARRTAPDLPLVLSGACWGGVNGLIALDPNMVQDDNVIWSFHSYEPFLFTHQSASWVSSFEKLFAGVPYPPSLLTDQMTADLVAGAMSRVGKPGFETDTVPTPEVLTAMIDAYRASSDGGVARDAALVAAWADTHGIARNRLLLGEFGANRDGAGGLAINPAHRAAFLAAKRASIEGVGIGWAVWSWTGSFGVDDGQGRRAPDPQMCDALGLPGC